MLGNRKYLAATLIVGIVFFIGYGYLLSSSSINLAGPKIAMGLNIYSLVVSALISVLFALSAAMNAFLFARNRASAGKLGFAAVIAAIIPGNLCCTAFIPSLMAVFGASTYTVISTSGTLQGTFATYETPLMIVSMALLALSIIFASRNIAKCCVVRK